VLFYYRVCLLYVYSTFFCFEGDEEDEDQEKLSPFSTTVADCLEVIDCIIVYARLIGQGDEGVAYMYPLLA
jgi:hypothetical protein